MGYLGSVSFLVEKGFEKDDGGKIPHLKKEKGKEVKKSLN